MDAVKFFRPVLGKYEMKLFNLIPLFFFLLINTAGAAQVEKEWTFLLFLNGNNNLNRFGRDNLIDMEKIGSTNEVNIVTQWADIEYKKTKRILVTKSTDATQITSPTLQDMGANVDMGNWHTLVDFIKWGVANYPAKHYFIVVWDHGTGWHEKSLEWQKDISHDEISGHSISTKELGLAMAEAAKVIGHKVDIYGSDACEMAMVEIATEMSDSVDLYLGSEEDIPVEGWPYSRFLRRWVDAPFSSPRDVAGMVHTEFLEFYRGLRSRLKQATFSLFDLNETEQMIHAISQFGNEVRKISGANLPKAHEALIQTLPITVDYLDLLDFADQLRAANLEGLNIQVFQDLYTAATSYVLLNGATPRFEKKAKGISIWLPSSFRWYNLYLAKYKNLKFSGLTHWEENISILQQNK